MVVVVVAVDAHDEVLNAGERSIEKSGLVEEEEEEEEMSDACFDNKIASMVEERTFMLFS